MNVFGVGGSELLFFLLLAGVFLGPRRIIVLVREAKKLIEQIQAIAKSISDELNQEIDLMEVLEGKPASRRQSEKMENHGAEDGSIVDGQDPEGQDGQENKEKLPEAYQKFREDFPEEGILDDERPDEASNSIKKPTEGRQPISASVRSNALASAKKRDNSTPIQVVPDSSDSGAIE